MDDVDQNLKQPMGLIKSRLPADNLLESVKAEMLKQKVFRALFGEQGERIFIRTLPSTNDTIIPHLFLKWKGERWQSQNTRVYGTIDGWVALPVDMIGRTDLFRGVAAAFLRWIEGKHDLFKLVPGLIEFGTNADFKYDNSIRAGGAVYPIVDISLPVVVDLTIFRAETPEADFEGDLDADLIGWIETYGLRIQDEDGDVLLDTQILSNTGQTQDG